jgi:uroporphyrin-III C-methyltransferase
LAAGALVSVVAERADPGFMELANDDRIQLHKRGFDTSDLGGVWLAIAASGDAAVDRQVADAAEQRQIFCEAVNATGTCQRPPSVQRGQVGIAVTGGAPADGIGRVDLVGAGPGDPGLLTLDAVAALKQADLILHDRLVPDAILDLANPAAERHYVGKARSRHSYEQGTLNELLGEHARQGRRVVRLKGGDPFVFGRGGEEMASLLTEGVPVSVIPGITAASGSATYAGIPLTHRDHAHSVHFLTAHRQDGAVVLDWGSVANPRQTLAIYMGLDGLEQVCRGLIQVGRAADTPAAVVENGTLASQRVAAGTLDDLPERVRDKELASPAMLLVGGVVGLRDQLAPACRRDDAPEG